MDLVRYTPLRCVNTPYQISDDIDYLTLCPAEFCGELLILQKSDREINLLSLLFTTSDIEKADF